MPRAKSALSCFTRLIAMVYMSALARSRKWTASVCCVSGFLNTENKGRYQVTADPTTWLYRASKVQHIRIVPSPFVALYSETARVTAEVVYTRQVL